MLLKASVVLAGRKLFLAFPAHPLEVEQVPQED